MNKGPLLGIDSFVPLGGSMDFTLVWDGYDIKTTFSRFANSIKFLKIEVI